MSLRIDGPAGELEALYHCPENAHRATLLCHPHPSYGGSMADGVLALASGALDDTWAHLRFNFRGVGASAGSHDNGVGEQDDLVAAWDWLRSQNRWESLLLIGYSFGSAMAWSARHRCTDLSQLLLIAPPTRAMPFELGGADKAVDFTTHIVVGKEDDYCDHERLPVTDSLDLLPNTDHFFSQTGQNDGPSLVAAIKAVTGPR